MYIFGINDIGEKQSENILGFLKAPNENWPSADLDKLVGTI